MQDSYEKFYHSVKEAAERFNRWKKSEQIQIISHLDADGISSCAILTKLLNNENRKYSISIIPQLDKDKIREISQSNSRYFIFADLGSGSLNSIKEHFKEKEVLILDHHEPESTGESSNIIHINPHLFGIDGSKEISGAGVVYNFAKALDSGNGDLAHIAILGAIGDVQEDKGFMRLNEDILNTAVERNKIKVKQGLRLYGMQTRPIHKVLEYSSNPNIPGVSGTESGSIQFLHQLGIEPKEGSRWKKINDLNEDEMQRLIAGIIIRRSGEGNPEDIIGKSYLMADEEEGSPTRDAKEFATLLNACGRMEKASFGIGACLGIRSDKQKAIESSLEYKKKLVESLKWYDENKDKLVKGEGFMILNAQDKVPPTIIGTLASILSKSKDILPGTYLLSLARAKDDMTKVSLRISGSEETDIDLREIVKEIVAKTGGEAGGHKYAAGALIETIKEDDFLKTAADVLTERAKQKV